MPRKRKAENLADQFEQFRADYAAAKHTRFRRRRLGVSSTGSGADYHYRHESEFLRMLEHARDMDRNDVMVGQTVTRSVVNVIQNGFKLDVNTGDPLLDVVLQDRWADWAEDPDQCDSAGEMTFKDLEWTVYRQAMVDGDILVLPLQDGTLQAVEAHRLRTPKSTSRNVVLGVLLDQQRKRQEYWITKDDVDPMRPVPKVSDIHSVPARDSEGNRQVFHVYDPTRVSQTRGVTALAPIFDVLGMFEDINFAKLVQQQIVSCFAIFRQFDVNSAPDPTDVPIGPQREEPLPDGTTRLIEGFAPGIQLVGQPGEQLEGFSPNVPNPEYFPHVRLMLTLVGVNLGLPLILVLMDGSETNFSGWRGAVDQARLGFRRNQEWMIRKFHTPVYLHKLKQWASEDKAIARAARQGKLNLANHQWNPPSWPYIEPLRDANADVIRLRQHLTSPRRLHAERGRDWDIIKVEIVEDHTEMILAAKTAAAHINAQFPDDDQMVSWRDVLSLGLIDRFTANYMPPELPGEEDRPSRDAPPPPQKAPADQSNSLRNNGRF